MSSNPFPFEGAGAGPTSATAASSTTSGQVTPTFFDVFIELAVVIALAGLASLDSEAGSLIVWFMIAVWLVFLVRFAKAHGM